MHQPWRALRELSDWTLEWSDLPDGVLGETDFDEMTIRLQRGMLQRQRRSTICHEVRHVHRGPVPDDDRLAAREELIVEREAARLLIELHPLGEAMAWSHSLDEVAEDLHVDMALLQARLDSLHPVERAYLRRRLEACEE